MMKLKDKLETKTGDRKTLFAHTTEFKTILKDLAANLELSESEVIRYSVFKEYRKRILNKKDVA